MTARFAPSLELVVAALARRPLVELWEDPHELARVTLEAALRSGVTDVLFPFDTALLAEAVGLPVRWSGDRPNVEPAEQESLLDADPSRAAEAGRTTAAVDVTRFLASSSRVASHVPTPRELVRAVGADADDQDNVDAAEDIVLAFLRRLLEAGGSSVVVRGELAGPEDLRPMERLGTLFAAPVFATGGPDVVTIDAEPEGEEALDRARGALLVVTSGPVPPTVELGRFAAFASEIVRC